MKPLRRRPPRVRVRVRARSRRLGSFKCPDPLPRSVDLFGQAFSALVLAVAAGALWLVLRKRSRAAATAALLVGAVLVLGCFLPPPREAPGRELRGSLSGSADFAIDRGASAAPRIDGGGSFSLTPTRALLACPTSCSFTATDVGLALEADGSLVANVTGGPLELQSQSSACTIQPWTIQALTLQVADCSGCTQLRFEASAGAEQALRGAQSDC
jgi:hypothetical protein